MDNNNDNKKEIKVVHGSGAELEFSPVYDHLNVVKPKAKKEDEKKKKIIIPQSKSEKKSQKKQ